MADPERRQRDEIESLAEDLLAKHGMYSAPVDPIRLASALSIPIFNATFDDNTISGMLMKRGPSITMLINANEPAYRKRFTIAHELGHRVLNHFPDDMPHTDHRTDMFRSETEPGTDLAEVQANQFAAALLMPRELVKRAWEFEKDVDKLAQLFQVSADAMGIRLNTLRLL